MSIKINKIGKIHAGFVFFFIFIILLISNVTALTASIGNARAVIYPEIVSGELTTIERTILVKNVNDVPVNITLEPLETIANITEIIDKNFILQPGTEKNAKFNIKLKYPGNYDGKIFVKFSPHNAQGSSVGLASTIIIRAKEAGSEDNEDDFDDDLDYTDEDNLDNIDNETSEENIDDDNLDNTGITGFSINVDKKILFAIIPTAILVILFGVLIFFYIKSLKIKQKIKRKRK